MNLWQSPLRPQKFAALHRLVDIYHVYQWFSFRHSRFRMIQKFDITNLKPQKQYSNNQNYEKLCDIFVANFDNIKTLTI